MSSKIRVIFLFVFSFIFIHCGGGGNDDPGSGVTGESGDISESVSGSLSESDEDLDGFYIDYYILEDVPEGATIWAEVDPSGFDAVLRLSDEDVDLYTADSEDCGVGCKESLLQSAYRGSGRYVLSVSSYYAGETGSYTLEYTVTADEG